MDAVLGFMLLAATTVTAALYWAWVIERLHRRRIERRLEATRHLAAVVRARFAEQRRLA